MVAEPGEHGDRDLSARLDAQAYRLVGLLLLVGGAVLLLVLVGVLQLPRVEREGSPGFALPGTAGRHVLQPSVVPVLGIAGGVMAALGLLAVALGRARAGFVHPLRARPGCRWRPALILTAGLALLALALIRR